MSDRSGRSRKKKTRPRTRRKKSARERTSGNLPQEKKKGKTSARIVPDGIEKKVLRKQETRRERGNSAEGWEKNRTDRMRLEKLNAEDTTRRKEAGAGGGVLLHDDDERGRESKGEREREREREPVFSLLEEKLRENETSCGSSRELKLSLVEDTHIDTIGRRNLDCLFFFLLQRRHGGKEGGFGLFWLLSWRRTRPAVCLRLGDCGRCWRTKTCAP